MQNIPMVDLKAQMEPIKAEIDQAFQEIFNTTRFIGGPMVSGFADELAKYLDVAQVIPCANGTDALQIAMMALKLQPGDEVIVPAFTYVATAEVIALLHLKPVMVDVDLETFNIRPSDIEKAISAKTKAIVPVHLFGQSCEMQGIMDLAKAHDIFVIEDNAQAIGADFTDSNGHAQKTGTIGDIGCTSFFPSKNLGCYGDGGAICTNDESLGSIIRMMANHGQTKQYHHGHIGVNSRLDAFQAAVLAAKLPHLDRYNASRAEAANWYNAAFKDHPHLITPKISNYSSHVFHQYVLRVTDGRRDELLQFLREKGIGCNIYYPIPLYKQAAYAHYNPDLILPNTELLCQEVIALPVHSELDKATSDHIIHTVLSFWN